MQRAFLLGMGHGMHTDIINNIPFGVIEKSPIHSYGLFARQDIAVESAQVSLDGQIVPRRVYKSNRDMAKDPINEWNALTTDMLLVRPRRTQYSFINHSRKPNCTTVNLGNRLHVRAITDNQRREELTLDYRLEALPPEYISSVCAGYL